MQRWLLLILGVIILYLVPSLLLQAVYGDSYGFMAPDNSWTADGQGGWKMKGFPDSPIPAEPSLNVPIFLQIAPFLLPLLLILFRSISFQQYPTIRFYRDVIPMVLRRYDVKIPKPRRDMNEGPQVR